MARPTVIRNVRLFDGRDAIPQATVTIADSIIADVSYRGQVAPGADLIEGEGRTLLPGLIDSHTHVPSMQPYADAALRRALAFGVTTELDMNTTPRTVAEIKRRQAAGEAPDMADVRSSGRLITALGGHGTEYGGYIQTISGPHEAQAFVDERIAEGSDYIKIIHDDRYGFRTLDRPTIAAVADATHRRGKLAIAHIGTQDHARDAIEAGVDGLAHVFNDRSPDPDFGRLLAGYGAFLVPTLAICGNPVDLYAESSLTGDPRVTPYLSDADLFYLRGRRPAREYPAEEAVRECRAAGVRILAGTDAPNPGTLHGASLHHELELLVRAGLPPREVLAAATSVPADVFGLSDRGRIAPGLRADLVLVEGDPTVDITATRAIVGVWKRGIQLDRRKAREQAAQVRADIANRSAPRGSESGWVSDFEGAEPTVRFGGGWRAWTGGNWGGASIAEIRVVEGGANGSRGSLLITGEVDANAVYPFVGAILHLGSEPWEPVNLSAHRTIAFWARGDGQPYRLQVYAYEQHMSPASAPFLAGPHWQEFEFPLSRFQAIDGHDLLALLFAAGPAPCSFSLQIDDVRFR